MTNIKDAPLKPCPFCGAKPHSGLGAKYHDQLHGEPHQDFAIWCPKGHAKVARVNREQATDEWNTRASTASPDREKVALSRDDLLAILNGYLSVEVRGQNGGWQEIVGAEDAVDAILRLTATITPDEAAIRAAAFEEAAKIVTSRVEGMELQRFVCNGATCTDTRGNDLFIAKSDVERLLTDRAAAIRSQEAGR